MSLPQKIPLLAWAAAAAAKGEGKGGEAGARAGTGARAEGEEGAVTAEEARGVAKAAAVKAAGYAVVWRGWERNRPFSARNVNEEIRIVRSAGEWQRGRRKREKD